MKKQTINKSTLLLAFLAVACWCFYFWQEKENQKFIEETQGIVIDFNEKNRNREYYKNRSFIDRVNSSWVDSIGFVDEYPKSPIKELFYKNVPKEYNAYIQSIYDFEREFFYTKRYDLDFKYNNKYREKYLSEIKNSFQTIISNYSNFKKVKFHKVNWNEINNEVIWLDLVQQRKEIIQIVDSIFEENKKKFPTSYVSNNFEGYSTLIPNYENQTMLVKVYWFPSDTKYYSDYGGKNRRGIVHNNFQVQDSTYDRLADPKIFYTFNKVGDTLIFALSHQDIPQKANWEREFAVPFRIISKKLVK